MEISDIRRALGLENIDLEDIDRIKLQLQQINDTISGGIRSANLKEYRNTYVINAQDSLDATYPMYVHFNIISEMTRIISIKLSFWFLNFRAYSTAASSGGAVTSASGGGETPTSSSVSTPSGGGDTSGATGSASGGGSTSGVANASTGAIRVLSLQASDGYYLINTYESSFVVDENHNHTTPNHTHPNHTHSTPNHTHPAHSHTVTIAAHTHVGGAHTHGITYGIHEEENSPTVVPSISRDNGLTWSLPIGSYTKDQENLDVTRFIDTKGSKMIRFTSTTRARLSVQITIKLDIRAR